MSRPDDYGIVAEALRTLVDAPPDCPDETTFKVALAALERLASGEHAAHHCGACGEVVMKAGRVLALEEREKVITPECAKNRRDCLAKVRG